MENEWNSMKFYDEFEGCEHIVEELYDYAMRMDVTPVLVDHVINQAYLDRKGAYDSLHTRGGPDYDAKLRTLNVLVLEAARKEIVDFTRGRKGMHR